MSEETEATPCCCASCGIAVIDEIKLKECDDCDLARYCSDLCREEHRMQHEEDCKKRAAELRDELLFKQPESSHLGDCPICFLPLPLDLKKSNLNTCCSTIICKGCNVANEVREIEMKLQHKCPFCRKALADTDEEVFQQNMRRIEANDPVAMLQQGMKQCNTGDNHGAIEYYTMAAALGNAEAHFKLALAYHLGEDVEKKWRKEIHHLEEAAIGGHPDARYHLGCDEWENNGGNGKIERAIKHWIISATQGEDNSIKCLMFAFKKGFVEKDDLAATLRAHQAAVDATKSPQREAAERIERIRGRGLRM